MKDPHVRVNARRQLQELTLCVGPDIVLCIMWGQGHKRVFGAAALWLLFAAGARADVPAPGRTPFEEKTEIANQTFSAIGARVQDIESLRAQASREGKAMRQSCIDEKLKRSKANQAAGKVIIEGWSLGESNLQYAQRSLDRMMLLSVYSMVYAEEARACADADSAADRLDVKLDQPKDGTGADGDRSRYGTSDDDLLKPQRPPNFERPPLASPY